MVLAALLALGVAAAPGQADSTSLPAVSSGTRPGPDLLYAPAAQAPQLQNASPWRAPPILVSGAEAYRQGEFLYQDYLFDDYGAAGIQDPNDPFSPPGNLFAPKHGTLTYPTDPVLASNAADLVELRVKPLADETAFRVTLNTLKDAGRTAFTIALGDSTVPRPWPDGAGVVSPARLFLTVHGTTATLTDATTETVLAPAPTASVDMLRRQIDVRVPHAAWNPGTAVVRMAAGVGLWDQGANGYLKPGPTATATRPGGAAPGGAALFNMAFRLSEPVPRIYQPGIANTIAEGGVLVAQDGSWWRERRQADALTSGDVGAFSAEVDFAKLAARADDESAVPQTGHFDRIMASHFDLGQGVQYSTMCLTSLAECTGRYVGQLQPYAVYVPPKPVPRTGFGLVVSMHGLSANYNEFLGSHEAEQFGDRGSGSILASPESRGPDGSYKSYAEADVFEMWADVARHYRLNPDLTDVTGYSMGGGGTYRLATRWPDLWARAFPIVGPPSSAASFVSLRNVPVMAWYGQTDELVGPELSEQAFLAAQQSGLRYDHWLFTPAGHITEGNNDEFGPAAAFLGDHTVERSPAHVTYLLDPSLDTKTESPADHAYWLSGLTARMTGATGRIDAVSRAFGVGDPPVLPVALSAGTLNGGSHGPLPYQRRTLSRGPVAPQARANQIDLTATNIVAATVDLARAGVGCDARVAVTSDGPLRLTMAGCDLVSKVSKGTSTIAACLSRRGFVIHPATRIHGVRVTSALVSVGGGPARRVRGRQLAVRISLKGARAGRVKVRIVSRLASGRTVTSTRTYRTCVTGTSLGQRVRRHRSRRRHP